MCEFIITLLNVSFLNKMVPQSLIGPDFIKHIYVNNIRRSKLVHAIYKQIKQHLAGDILLGIVSTQKLPYTVHNG